MHLKIKKTLISTGCRACSSTTVHSNSAFLRMLGKGGGIVGTEYCFLLAPVLRIRGIGTYPDPDRGSIPLTNGSCAAPDDIKLFFSLSFLLITVLFEATFTSFFKDKISQRSHKTVGIFFLLFLLGDRRIRICTSD
jgi:hypothetical protein